LGQSKGRRQIEAVAETEHTGCPDGTKIRRTNFLVERPGPGRVLIG
jgi:hypothetical protein